MDERSIAMDLKRNAVQSKLREENQINVHRLNATEDKTTTMEFVNVSALQSKNIERSKMVCESGNLCNIKSKPIEQNYLIQLNNILSFWFDSFDRIFSCASTIRAEVRHAVPHLKEENQKIEEQMACWSICATRIPQWLTRTPKFENNMFCGHKWLTCLKLHSTVKKFSSFRQTHCVSQMSWLRSLCRLIRLVLVPFKSLCLLWSSPIRCCWIRFPESFTLFGARFITVLSLSCLFGWLDSSSICLPLSSPACKLTKWWWMALRRFTAACPSFAAGIKLPSLRRGIDAANRSGHSARSSAATTSATVLQSYNFTIMQIRIIAIDCIIVCSNWIHIYCPRYTNCAVLFYCPAESIHRWFIQFAEVCRSGTSFFLH